MKSRTILFTLLASTLLPALRASASLPYYVSDLGNINVSVSTDSGPIITPPGVDYNSGNLLQHSVSGQTHTGVAGTLTTGGDTPHIQSADGSISDSVQIGALHTLVKATATTDNYPYGDVSNATARSEVHSTTSWFDTIRFQTSNLAGSDFTATIFLDDHIDNSAAQQENSKFSVVSSAHVTLNYTGFFDPVPLPPSILDVKGLQSDGPISQPPDSFVQSVTFHVHDNQSVTFVETLDVVSSLLGGNTSSVADVSNTAGFLLTTSDPAASYTSASGTIFPTPEPSTLPLLALASLALTRRRK